MRPSSILDIIYSGEAMASMVKTDVKRPVQGEWSDALKGVIWYFSESEEAEARLTARWFNNFHRRCIKPTGHCLKCGAMASQTLCQACALLDTLNKGVAKLDIAAARPTDPQAAAVKLSSKSTAS